MAKIKNLLPESKSAELLVYTERKDKKDDKTHNVRTKRLRPRKRRAK